MIIAICIVMIKTHLYKCVMMTGHRGAGKRGERVFYLRAVSSYQAMRQAKGFNGVKKGRHYRSASSLLSLELVA
jgi:hypothetical protein